MLLSQGKDAKEKMAQKSQRMVKEMRKKLKITTISNKMNIKVLRLLAKTWATMIRKR